MSRAKLVEEFNRRVSSVYWPERKRAAGVGGGVGNDPADDQVRHQGFRALTDSFLGEHYDKEKLRNIENLQIALRQTRAQLNIALLRDKTLSPEQYLRQLKELNLSIFRQMEAILGEADFVRLFGADSSHANDTIDDEAFLSQYRGLLGIR